MSVTARSLLLIGAFLALLLSQYAVAHAIGHQIAFLIGPDIVPEPMLIEHPLLHLALGAVAFAALLELLVGNPIPLQGWFRPFDRIYSGQHGAYLLIAMMALIVVSFTFLLIRDSEALQSWFWWTVLGVDGLLGVAVGLTIYAWLRMGKVTPFAAE